MGELDGLRCYRTPIPCPEPGVYGRDVLSMEQYLALQAVRAGLLKDVLDRTPLYAASRRWVKKGGTEATERGTAVHLAILEPERFDLVYGRLSPDYDGRTSAGKSEKALLVSRGLHPLKAETWEACVRLRERAWSIPLVRSLLEQAETESTAVWETEHAGIFGAARADVLAREAETVVDLKTTGDASPWAFGRSAAENGYHLSAPWYLDGFTAAGCRVRYWWMLALEADDDAGHYDVALYALDDLVVARARERMKRALDAWARCHEGAVAPGYVPNIVPLPLPAWAFKEDPIR